MLCRNIVNITNSTIKGADYHCIYDISKSLENSVFDNHRYT